VRALAAALLLTGAAAAEPAPLAVSRARLIDRRTSVARLRVALDGRGRKPLSATLLLQPGRLLRLRLEDAGAGELALAFDGDEPLPLYAARCEVPAAQAEVEGWLTSLKKIPFDDVRLDSARRFVERQCATSSQVRSFAEVLSTDALRLELAKKTFQHVHDPERFVEALSPALADDGTREALRAFVDGL
jgi:hypothetical protein